MIYIMYTIHAASAAERNCGAMGKIFFGALMTSFFPNCRKTTQGRQYSKAWQKTLLKKPLNFKHYKRNINTANIIIIVLYYNFIGPLSRFVALVRSEPGTSCPPPAHPVSRRACMQQVSKHCIVL